MQFASVAMWITVIFAHRMIFVKLAPTDIRQVLMVNVLSVIILVLHAMIIIHA